MTPEQWEQAVRQAREPLGEPRDRRLESSEHSTELPYAPPGEYVVLVYTADFEAGPHREQLVMQRERDGEWRAIGYWVRP